MKLSSLISILLAILLLAPIKAIPSGINDVPFSGEIAGGAYRLGNEAVELLVTPLQLENGTTPCCGVVTSLHAGRSRVALAPETYERGAVPALVGRW